MDEETRWEAAVGAGDHPSDRLPEYVRGTSPDPEALEAHLSSCSRCREEVELLRALAGPGPFLEPGERERLWERAAARGHGAGRGPAWRSTAGPAWLSVAWKVAAAVALVATGFGVWQVNRQAAAGGEGWDPTAALRGWEEDVETLRPGPEDVRLALGYGGEEAEVAWEELDARDAARVRAPWEEVPR